MATLQRRVLLVEDSAGDAELTCESLARAPAQAFEVLRAASLAESLLLLSARTVDLVILDLNLPDSRGVDTVRRIRVVLSQTPIVVVTGVVDEHLRSQAIAEGAEDVFAKEESHTRLFWRSIAHIIERRREQQRQFQRVLDATPDAILVVNDAGLMLYVNQSAVDLFGRSREDLQGESLGFSVADNVPAEIRIARPDGERVCEMRVVRMEWNDERAYLASVRDVTERKRAEQALAATEAELRRSNQELERLASTDPLTLLANRRQFFVRLEAEIKRAGRHGESLALVMLDLDHFKRINDAHGHAVGDQVLRAVGALLASCVREWDMAARLGGEEFALILPTTDRGGAREVAERVRARILDLRCRTEEGLEVTVSASCGGAILSETITSGDQLLVAADNALYDAKARGRDRVSMDDTLVGLPKLSS